MMVECIFTCIHVVKHLIRIPFLQLYIRNTFLTFYLNPLCKDRIKHLKLKMDISCVAQHLLYAGN